MHNTQQLDVQTEVVKLGTGKLAGQKIAHMTGTTQIKLEDAARKEIKDFVTAGGTLIIDAAGGSGIFAQSAQTELEAIFGADAKSLADPLPQDPERVAATLTKAGLGNSESWSFTDRFYERLRYEIDPAWAGELPRTVMIDRDGKDTVLPGVAGLLQRYAWLVPDHDPRGRPRPQLHGDALVGIDEAGPDDDVDFNIVANESRPAAVDVALSNSFGFGGTNASLLMRKLPPSPRLQQTGEA